MAEGVKRTLRRAALRGLESTGRAVRKAGRAATVVHCELMVSLAAPEDWAELTRRAYDHNRYYLNGAHSALFPFEEQAIREFFPPPPRKVLVGAAGSGRELLHLTERGYQVAGFDPSTKLVAAARKRVTGAQLLAMEVASYELLIEGIDTLDALAPFDAVIMGWGSLSHLASPSTRRSLLQRLRLLCPEGPLLVSWVCERPGASGVRVRKLLRSLGVPTPPESVTYDPRSGFVRGYDHHEIFDLAWQGGYRVASYCDGPRAHAVLIPEGAAARDESSGSAVDSDRSFNA